MPSKLKRCPCCLTPTLKDAVLSQQQVMECSQCKGLWFEDGALNSAIAHKHEHIDEYEHEVHLGERMRTGERQCRRCDVAMEHYHLLEHYETEIDCCPSCDGVWLDRQEVQQVLQSPALSEALQRLNSKVNWRSWVFQFLTTMPVEYNLKAQRIPWATYMIIAACTVIFMLGQLTPGWEAAIYETLGFNSNSGSGLRSAGQLLSYQFVHGSWMHLLGNMYFLWVVGDNLEDALGHWRFLGLYLLAGAVAGLVEWGFYNNAQGPLLLVGASGSIAALFGLYLVWFRFASLSFMIVVFQVKLAPHWYFLLWSAINIIGMAMGETGVAYWAHLGGLVFGIAAGLVLSNWVRERNIMVDLLNQPEASVQR